MGYETSTLPHAGDLIDARYRIDRILGEGGTSTVFQVSHIITDKKFAIKWLLPELALDEAAVDRFIQEARVGGRFSHPYAVQVYDICKANDSFYMLMEFLEGESLQARLERVGQLPAAAVCAIALICTEVLRAAHQAGIIHRDLKPANIFLCAATDLRGEIPKLLDFGISTFCAERQQAGAGSVIGTPLYMAPEQMLGEPADPRTDIYALGAVLYELVSGRPPFHADNYNDLVALVTGDAVARPLSELADVDAAFAAIVAKAMAREPSARFASMSELAQALSRYAADRGITPLLSFGESTVTTLTGQTSRAADGGAAHDLEAAWQAERAPSRPAKRKRSAALALTLGVAGALLSMLSGQPTDHHERAASAAATAPLEADLHASTDEAPDPLVRLELAAEPVALAEERPNVPMPMAASRAAAHSGAAPKHKLEAQAAAKSDAAYARKVAGRDAGAGHLRADANAANTPRAAASQAGSVHPNAAPRAAAGRSSAAPPSVTATHASTVPASNASSSTPLVRVNRSDFGGDAPSGARMPAAAVSRQDF